MINNLIEVEQLMTKLSEGVDTLGRIQSHKKCPQYNRRRR